MLHFAKCPSPSLATCYSTTSFCYCSYFTHIGGSTSSSMTWSWEDGKDWHKECFKNLECQNSSSGKKNNNVPQIPNFLPRATMAIFTIPSGCPSTWSFWLLSICRFNLSSEFRSSFLRPLRSHRATDEEEGFEGKTSGGKRREKRREKREAPGKSSHLQKQVQKSQVMEVVSFAISNEKRECLVSNGLGVALEPIEHQGTKSIQCSFGM